ncbi:ephrin-B2a-like [Thalassophryne amazonica]|uniref:ephrin-B2a-like n=1 Tax=Thalassophryne amazonica TaxID=390379 RepID=UPI001470C20E|nr:ephrin-B2a-like [Thalassophryne amazonica]
MGRSTWSCRLTVLLDILSWCGAATLESISWSSSNTKFTPGEGLVLYPQIGDKMDIVCPRVGMSSGEKEEFYRLYLVTQKQMQSCTVDKTDTPLLNCDKPHQDVKFTFKFQEFSPNLWGLEFLKGKDYYITSTSTSSIQGLDNTDGGVCRTKSMKLVLRVGQSSSDPLSTLLESPTRFPPKQPKSKANKDPTSTEQDLKSSSDAEMGHLKPRGNSGSEPRLLVWVVCSCTVLLLAIIILLVLLWRHNQHRCVPDSQQSTSMSLNTLAVTKRDSISSDNNDSERSDVVFPLRPADSMICRHYEHVSSDYGAPVYIVQEVTPQSPANIYYKV